MKDRIIALKEYNRLIVLIVTCVLLISLLYINLFTKNNEDVVEPEEIVATTVETLEVGSNIIYTKAIAKTDNQNKITISSLTGGIANSVKADPGDEVNKDSKLLEITETYTGNELFDIQVDLAQKQVDQASKNFKLLDSIDDEREDLADEQLDEFNQRTEVLRTQLTSINGQINEINGVILDIEDIIIDMEDFEDSIHDEADDNPNFTEFMEDQTVLQNNSGILGLKQAIAQYQLQIASLESQKEMLEYQTNNNYPGIAIADLTNEITKAQIKTERDIAKLSLDLSELNLELVKTQAELRTVISPIKGTVEEVRVKKGELVSPGQPLFVINGELDLILTAKISAELAGQIDERENALIEFEGKVYTLNIKNVSNIPVNGYFYEVLLNPGKELKDLLRIGSSYEISLPIRSVESKDSNDSIFIPIDSVFKTNTLEYVLVFENGKAIERQIVTGEIIGAQIRVLEGLTKGEIIILDRRIIPGENVKQIEQINNEDSTPTQETDTGSIITPTESTQN